jgi:hypothetical protein
MDTHEPTFSRVNRPARSIRRNCAERGSIAARGNGQAVWVADYWEGNAVTQGREAENESLFREWIRSGASGLAVMIQAGTIGNCRMAGAEM